MKKLCLIILALLSVSVSGYAAKREYSHIANSRTDIKRVAVGIRGGAMVPYGNANKATISLNHKIGMDAMVDVQYEKYNYNRTSRVNTGVLVGLSFGMQQWGLAIDSLKEKYAIKTDDGRINYSIYAEDIKETKRLLVAEIPIMFAMRTTKGFFLNVGPRFCVPFMKRSTVSLSNDTINAYFTEEDVLVRNRIITGKTNQSDKAIWNAPIVSLKVGVELGYEWRFRKGALGLGAYVNWEALPIYLDNSSGDYIVQITAPSQKVQPASVRFNSPTEILAPKSRNVCAGLKINYHFNLN